MHPLRWRFPDESEASARAEVTRRIDAWWEEFVRRAPALNAHFSGGSEWDLPAWMERHFDAIGTGLFWEFGPGVQRPHRLVLTAESNRWARPLVSTILARAPTDTDFDFFPYRLAEPIDLVEATVEGRTGLSLAGFSARAAPDEAGAIAVTVFCDDEPDRERETAGFVMLEALLGEEILDRWIGAISYERGTGDALDRLKPEVDRLIAARRAALPSVPWVRRVGEATWSLLKIEPKAAPDYFEQRDLFLGKTTDLELFNNARDGSLFDSSRHSRCGETFAYLKTDGSEGLPDDGFPDKASIEDALDAALVVPQLGCHIGGGTGRRYSYVDLALTDVDAAVPEILRALRLGKLPKRSWIQFFDSDLRWEWIGVYPDSPRPPLPDIED